METGTLVISTPAVITVFYGSSPPVASDKSTLLVSVSPSGHGKISGQSSGASLEVNKVYTVKATPVGNWIFTNWTVGSSAAAVLSSNACLSFIMTPGLMLRANFIQNPFPSLSGVYNGLFSPSAGTGEASSGAIVVTLAATSRGAYTARLMLDGSWYSFSGGFDLPGDSEVTVVRPGKPPVGVILHINTDLSTTDNLMTGYVVNFASSGWISPVLAERAVFSASNPATSYSGKHTLIILPGRVRLPTRREATVMPRWTPLRPAWFPSAEIWRTKPPSASPPAFPNPETSRSMSRSILTKDHCRAG